MYGSPSSQVTGKSRTTEGNSGQMNDVCASDYGMTVESSILMRPTISGVLQGACAGGFGYTGYNSTGDATANGSCTRSVQWDEVRMDLGHRVWVTGTYYDPPTGGHVGIVSW